MLNKVKSFGQEVVSFMSFAIFPIIVGVITYLLISLLRAIVKAIFSKVTS